jgi:hypothetical protein
MIDQETQERLQINTDGDAGPYLMVPLEQIPTIRALLQRHGIIHTVDDDAIQLDGRPVIAVVNFGRGSDAARLQRLLDDVE